MDRSGDENEMEVQKPTEAVNDKDEEMDTEIKDSTHPTHPNKPFQGNGFCSFIYFFTVKNIMLSFGVSCTYFLQLVICKSPPTLYHCQLRIMRNMF